MPGVAITIRNVPKEVRDELAMRAARTGRSMQEYLCAHLAELASRPTAEDVIARARDRARTLGHTVDAESIVAARNADRG
jgi:plasmid stability protein